MSEERHIHVDMSGNKGQRKESAATLLEVLNEHRKIKWGEALGILLAFTAMILIAAIGAGAAVALGVAAFHWVSEFLSG